VICPDNKLSGKHIFTLVGMVEDVAGKIRSSVLALKPKLLEESTKPRRIEWQEKPQLFLWGGRRWRCTLKEDRRGDVKIYLVGFEKTSDALICDRQSIQWLSNRLKWGFQKAGQLIIDPPTKLRRQPYRKPRSRVFDPILRRMVSRSPQSELRAFKKWERKEGYRKTLFTIKKEELKRHKEARRNKRLAIYEAACRERERVWKEKGIDEDFGRSKQWQKARKQVIKEWQGVCAVCCLKIEGLIHIHHIHPKGKFPEKALDFENLAPVHAPCHAKIHSSKPAKVHQREVTLKKFNKKMDPQTDGIERF